MADQRGGGLKAGYVNSPFPELCSLHALKKYKNIQEPTRELYRKRREKEERERKNKYVRSVYAQLF